jgi:hypothetical protein
MIETDDETMIIDLDTVMTTETVAMMTEDNIVVTMMTTSTAGKGIKSAIEIAKVIEMVEEPTGLQVLHAIPLTTAVGRHHIVPP